MTYTPKDFSNLIGLAGFSDTALNTHFALYQGYVNNTNKLLEKLSTLAPDSPEYAECKRRFGWEFNGMRLHEYYFSAMTHVPADGPSPLDPTSKLYQKIVADFGSYEAWEKDFRATASMRGIGWTILYYDQVGDTLINTWINEHDLGHLADCKLLLNLDVFEHAFMLDYNTKRVDYINAFMSAVDWSVISQRFVF